ncbi:hypothetical protein CSPX01_05900 [Colletotrichum filicis]|nr:hypothetical protein CSPX01_05900 [Colletotrichum filicis]
MAVDEMCRMGKSLAAFPGHMCTQRTQLLLFGEQCPEKHRELEPTRPRKQGNDGKTGSGPGKGQGVLLAGGD